MPKQEELTEIEIGPYTVPVPFLVNQGGVTYMENVQVSFELYGLVTPDNVKKFTELLEARRGRFNDEVIRICRRIEPEDLRDPSSQFLSKALKEAGDKVLGRQVIRRFVLSDYQLELQ